MQVPRKSKPNLPKTSNFKSQTTSFHWNSHTASTIIFMHHSWNLRTFLSKSQQRAGRNPTKPFTIFCPFDLWSSPKTETFPPNPIQKLRASETWWRIQLWKWLWCNLWPSFGGDKQREMEEEENLIVKKRVWESKEGMYVALLDWFGSSKVSSKWRILWETSKHTPWEIQV